MNKFFLSCTLAALLFLAPVVSLVAPDTGNEGILANERRTMAAFPDMPSRITSGTIKEFFRGIDAFFADRFPLRAPLLGLPMAVYEAGGDSLNRDKCYRGKENWLFLGNSYARCVDKLQGVFVLSDAAARRQAEAYEKRRAVAEACGAEFFVLVGPNKSSVYPEYLPPVVVPARQRFIAPLLDALRAAGVRVYDPTERLGAAKSAGLLYYRTDTHWNDLGALEAFEGLRALAGLPALPPLALGEGPAYRGDLVDIGGYQSFPLSAGDNFTLRWQEAPAVREDGGVFRNARAASAKTAWVFGDSFATALRPYITAMFAEVRFFKHGEFDAAMASALPKPDMVWWVMVERDFAQAK